MQTFDCTVRLPSGYVQNFTVETYTVDDAIDMIESQTGGDCINIIPLWADNSNSNESESNSNVSGGFILICSIFLILIYSWKWIIFLVAISALLFAIYSMFKD